MRILAILCSLWHEHSLLVFHDDDGDYRRCLTCGRRITAWKDSKR